VVLVIEHPFAIGELLEPDRAAPGEGVCRGNDDHELLPGDHRQRAVPRPNRQRPDCEVGDALLDRVLEEGPVPELVQPDADVGIPLVPDADVARQQPHGHGEHSRDLELARLERELAKVHRVRLSRPWPIAPLDLSGGVEKTPGRVRALRINHVSISATDLERSTRFYEDVLAMERIPTPTFESPVQWLRVGDMQLHLFLDDRPAPSRHHLGMTIDDFDTAYQAVKARASAMFGF